MKNNKKKVLVTGGCGYIGSHTIVDLLDSGYDVVSADNLINSDESVLDVVEELTGLKIVNYTVDLANRNACKNLFASIGHIDAVIHFAALKNVGESVELPLQYYHNNLNSQINLMDMCETYKIRWFVFSSSCSVYGNPDNLPVDENTPHQKAESPYAHTKQIGEEMIHAHVRSKAKVKYVLLRYFNPAGAHPSGLMGENPRNIANNLVPVITETAIGKRDEVVVFGEDYPTRDGSCIRDYIHVMDLAHAHTLALNHLINNNSGQIEAEAFNLGIGEGVSVKEAITAFERSTGQKLNYRIGPRRAGDVVAVYADAKKARQILGWNTHYTIDQIMQSAWKWELYRSGKSIS
jgi:UDP-glucose 4-epimerase